MHHAISLGAGVQSSTMALMASVGEITPMPDFAIFADTQDEPKKVYDWLAYLTPLLSFPVHTVTAGKLSEASLTMREARPEYSRTNIPFFTKNSDGSLGMVQHRSCTKLFKIDPIHRFLKKECKVGTKSKINKKRIVQWIGISIDEFQRAKESKNWWLIHRWPLIELRYSRRDCLNWMSEHGYETPPRSACVFCPYRDNKGWRSLKRDSPDDFEKAVQFELATQKSKEGTGGNDSVPYIHRKRIPLSQVDFRNDFDKGQLPLWDDECEGMCGV